MAANSYVIPQPRMHDFAQGCYGDDMEVRSPFELWFLLLDAAQADEHISYLYSHDYFLICLWNLVLASPRGASFEQVAFRPLVARQSD